MFTIFGVNNIFPKTKCNCEANCCIIAIPTQPINYITLISSFQEQYTLFMESKAYGLNSTNSLLH